MESKNLAPILAPIRTHCVDVGNDLTRSQIFAPIAPILIIKFKFPPTEGSTQSGDC